MSRPSSEYRDYFRDVLASGELYRLRRMRPCRNAANLDEVRRIAEDIVKMNDEELDCLRESLTPRQEEPFDITSLTQHSAPPSKPDRALRHYLSFVLLGMKSTVRPRKASSFDTSPPEMPTVSTCDRACSTGI